VGDVPLV